MNRKFIFGFLLIIGMISSVTLASAAPLMIEDFTYTAGALLTDNGWTAHSAAGTNAIATVAPGLTFAGYPSSGVGNAVAMTVSGEDDNRTFAAQTSGSVYAGFMVNVSDAAVDAIGGYFFHLGAETIGTSFRGRIFIKKDASNNIAFGISKASITEVVFTPFSYSLNTTYLIVLKYTIVDGASNDTVDLFVNTTTPATEPIPTASATDIVQSDISPGSVALRQGTAATHSTVKVDGIRVATNWAEIVELISDPGFEAGPPWPSWAQTSTNFGTPLCNALLCGTDAVPFAGGNWAWFGGIAAPEAATLSQSVTIPTGVTASLTFQLRIAFVSPPFTDTLTVQVDGTPVATFTEPAVAEVGYSLRTIDLTAYATGASHTILFSHVGPTSGVANFLVDDVNLTVTPLPPTVSSIAPPSGSTVGGTAVIITGTNFTGATGVTIGGNSGLFAVVLSPTSISSQAPAGSAGPASVLVTTPGGTNAPNSLYTYVSPAPPTVRIFETLVGYPSIQAAFAAALTGQTIQVQAGTYSENLVFVNPVSIVLKGGYDSTFAINSGTTAVAGSLTITDGAAVIDNIVIQ